MKIDNTYTQYRKWLKDNNINIRELRRKEKDFEWNAEVVTNCIIIDILILMIAWRA